MKAAISSRRLGAGAAVTRVGRVVAVLAGLLALTDIVSGLVVVLGAPSADLIEGLTREQTTLALRVIGGWFIVLGVAHAVIAWLIARRSTAARLALSVLLVLRLAQAWFLVSQLGTQALQGFWGLALAVLLVYLLWNSESLAVVRRRHITQPGRLPR